MTPAVLQPGPRTGVVVVPPSKSHAQRLIIANALAGDRACLMPDKADAEDVATVKRCCAALCSSERCPVLDCAESGATLRFLAPLAAALGKRPTFLRRASLAARPFTDYPTLVSGIHECAGDVSSQFVTGLLFALPLLKGDSEIRFTTPLVSCGYVALTCDVLRGAGIAVEPLPMGFRVPGGQSYRRQNTPVEGDWSGAAFWYAMNALGSDLCVEGLNPRSLQPDRAIAALLAAWPSEIDVSSFPDLFPVLTVVAAAHEGATRFTGIRRLRLKECDRVSAMAETLTKLGVAVSVSDDNFAVRGSSRHFSGGAFRTFGDHRIAMALAVAATHAASPIALDDTVCAAKSYPAFFAQFAACTRQNGRKDAI